MERTVPKPNILLDITMDPVVKPQESYIFLLNTYQQLFFLIFSIYTCSFPTA